MIATPVTTARLVIDLLTVDDAPSVAAYRSDPDVARYQGWTVPYAVEQAAALAVSGQLALRDRAGFRREGLLHHSHQSADGLVDEVLFAATADRWRPAAAEPEAAGSSGHRPPLEQER